MEINELKNEAVVETPEVEAIPAEVAPEAPESPEKPIPADEKDAEEPKKKKKKSKWNDVVWLTAIMLLIAILLTTAILFAQLYRYRGVENDPSRVEIDIAINLGMLGGFGDDDDGTTTDSGGSSTTETTTDGGGSSTTETTEPTAPTTDTSSTADSTTETTSDHGLTDLPPEIPITTPDPNAPITPNPGFEAVDELTTWSGETRVELFKVKYENATGEVIIQSGNGDKVIAPGSFNDKYYFDLRNIGNVGIDYTVTTSMVFQSTADKSQQVTVPLEAVFYKGGSDDYLLGTKGDGDASDTYASMYGLNGVESSGSLGAGYYDRYILRWQWPFYTSAEGDLADTALGNLAASLEEGDSLSVYVTINVKAEANYMATGGTLIK